MLSCLDLSDSIIVTKSCQDAKTDLIHKSEGYGRYVFVEIYIFCWYIDLSVKRDARIVFAQISVNFILGLALKRRNMLKWESQSLESAINTLFCDRILFFTLTQ